MPKLQWNFYILFFFFYLPMKNQNRVLHSSFFFFTYPCKIKMGFILSSNSIICYLHEKQGMNERTIKITIQKNLSPILMSYISQLGTSK